MMAKPKPIPQLDIHASNHKNAHIIIKVRLDELYSWDSCVDDPDRIQDLHNLRIQVFCELVGRHDGPSR